MEIEKSPVSEPGRKRLSVVLVCLHEHGPEDRCCMVFFPIDYS